MGEIWLWTGFIAFVTGMLALDLGVFHRKAHQVSLREAAVWSTVWVALALGFNAVLYVWSGKEPALQFLTGYIIEKTLSVDNLFVIAIIFSYFAIPPKYQHRVLFWGILGALVMRAVFITLGASLLARFHWVIYVFGALLILTGIKLLTQNHAHAPERSLVVRMFRRFMPVTAEHHGEHFTVVQNGRRYATPMLLALVAVEATDLVFAVDSIPAIFAVTSDPFLVFTSNIFAILGLRSLYFLLVGVLDRFRYLKPGLALVLAFVGVKMLVSKTYPIPIVVSLTVVVAILGGAVLVSLWRTRQDGRGALDGDQNVQKEHDARSICGSS
jgi:tellurite resistance protein TerC